MRRAAPGAVLVEGESPLPGQGRAEVAAPELDVRVEDAALAEVRRLLRGRGIRTRYVADLVLSLSATRPDWWAGKPGTAARLSERAPVLEAWREGRVVATVTHDPDVGYRVVVRHEGGETTAITGSADGVALVIPGFRRVGR
ncbi:hypothetical protein [Acrocarpospora sp. B8E8]|uniref:hypothetical protein n=1 Tax=Acrocarpospora sp. B8E8 TaxID=3153572 RepID=UPI00325DA8AD